MGHIRNITGSSHILSTPGWPYPDAGSGRGFETFTSAKTTSLQVAGCRLQRIPACQRLLPQSYGGSSYSVYINTSIHIYIYILGGPATDRNLSVLGNLGGTQKSLEPNALKKP